MQIKAQVTRRKRPRISVQQMAAKRLLNAGNMIGARAHAEGGNLTSGTVSTRDLRVVYNYPFSRRNPGRLPPLPINRQSGDLSKSLQVQVFSSPSTVIVSLVFTSPHAVVLTPGGLPNMIGRGFQDALRKAVRPTFLQARRSLMATRLK